MTTTTITELQNQVTNIFAEVTRYPMDILDPQANLEEDLGIDSVKLGEIFSVLREKYSLPEKLDIPAEKLKSIAGISYALDKYLSAASPAAGNGMMKSRVAAAGASNGNGHSVASVPAAKAPNGNGGAPGREATRNRIRQVFADVTRYPLDILEPGANLEEDLGIDSVKLGEIFSVLREEYKLPEKIDIPLEKLKTIDGIAETLHEYLSAPGPTLPAVEAPVLSNARNGAVDREAAATRIRKVFADVTRYPPEILEPHASLEEDLGIDSVKLGEIFSVLREEYQLPEKLDIPVEKLKTINGITEALCEYLSGRSQAGAAIEVEPSRNGHAHASPANGAGHQDAYAQSFAALTPERKPFRGKIALISGSGRGLGKDIAVYLAELGASVIVNSFHSPQRGIETAEEITERGGDAWHLWGSMANNEHLHRMFDQIEERYGTLDFFVSNASNGMLASIEDLTVEHWEKGFRTNVVGLHQGAVRAAKMMKKAGGGKIITLSSPAAHGYVEYFGCMGPVKAAVEALTRALAIEFAPYNIQVNCVSPGPIDGELLRKWPDSERLIHQWTENTPLGRLCEHRDVSHFVAYLLSQPVKAFTGSVLVLDGGISSQGW
jgi:enoyl-[acyl-carrier protein] reductase III